MKGRKSGRHKYINRERVITGESQKTNSCQNKSEKVYTISCLLDWDTYRKYTYGVRQKIFNMNNQSTEAEDPLFPEVVMEPGDVTIQDDQATDNDHSKSWCSGKPQVQPNVMMEEEQPSQILGSERPVLRRLPTSSSSDVSMGNDCSILS